jgi:hypothetical protein
VLAASALFGLGWFAKGQVTRAITSLLSYQLSATKDRLAACRAALAAEVAESNKRLEGAQDDMDKVRRLQSALSESDPDIRVDRLLLEFPQGEPETPPVKSDRETDTGGSPSV